MPAPANRWGPGKSLPVRIHVFTPPSTEMRTPIARRMLPQLVCLFLKSPATSSLRSTARASICFWISGGATASASPLAATMLLTDALSSEISFPTVRTRRQFQPSQPAHAVPTKSTAMTAGWMSATVRPCRIPKSPGGSARAIPGIISTGVIAAPRAKGRSLNAGNSLATAEVVAGAGDCSPEEALARTDRTALREASERIPRAGRDTRARARAIAGRAMDTREEEGTAPARAGAGARTVQVEAMTLGLRCVGTPVATSSELTS
mmetsp:Transcript_10434/g.33729  ORF Transcript_10434/g.33729 Transcript_10434/m.33729 type:complete len:264 (-) Transcript_10434:147-938(-)